MHVFRVNEERCDGCDSSILLSDWHFGERLIGVPAIEDERLSRAEYLFRLNMALKADSGISPNVSTGQQKR